MGLNEMKVGYALGTTWGILYAVCALLFMLVPRPTIGFFNYLFHGIALDPKPIDFGFAIVGLAVSSITAFAIGALFARVYNHFDARR
ncbi:TPA: hypothetical protein HA244_01445 [Candidatus Micrarchaeota archaeon]|nr:hypothetical protein [Candidatus Micrarchaeota archaeon]